jgi:hypothetical protein
LRAALNGLRGRPNVLRSTRCELTRRAKHRHDGIIEDFAGPALDSRLSIDGAVAPLPSLLNVWNSHALAARIASGCRTIRRAEGTMESVIAEIIQVADR